MKVFLDGRVVDAAEARIPVTDHGLLYGDGVFEGLRVAAGRVFRLDDHLARLERSARSIALEIPGGIAAARDAVLACARALGQPECYLRLIVTRGDGPLGVDPSACPRPRLLCIAAPIEIYPPDVLARGLDLITASVRRPGPDVLDPRVKSLNYLGSALARLEARQRGADEALLLNPDGAVAEASVANLFVCDGDRLRTPPATDGALEGITRRTLLELAAELGLRAAEARLARSDVWNADEAFLCGTGAGIAAIRSLDARALRRAPPGGITEKLRTLYTERLVRDGVPLGA